MTPPACRGWKIIGICLKVLALPIPAKKKTAIMPQKNAGKPPAELGWNCIEVQTHATAIPSADTTVILPPPMRSAIGPAMMRANEPTRAPQNTHLSGSMPAAPNTALP